MEEKQDGPEKSLFNSTERGEIRQPPAPPRDDRPAAEKYPPRDDKPGLYSLYDGDVHKDTFTTAAQAWEEFQKYGGKDVSIQPEFGGEILVIRRELTIEKQMSAGTRDEYPVEIRDDFKRDLVAEGRNPDSPSEPLPVQGRAAPAVESPVESAPQLHDEMTAMDLERVQALEMQRERFTPELQVWMDQKVEEQLALRAEQPAADRQAWADLFREKLSDEVGMAAEARSIEISEGALGDPARDNADLYREPAFSNNLIQQLDSYYGEWVKATFPEHVAPTHAKVDINPAEQDVRPEIKLWADTFVQHYIEAWHPASQYSNVLENEEAVAQARGRYVEALESHLAVAPGDEPDPQYGHITDPAELAEQLRADMIGEARFSASEFLATHASDAREQLTTRAATENVLIERARQELSEGRAAGVDTVAWHKVVKEFDAGGNWQASQSEARATVAPQVQQQTQQRADPPTSGGDPKDLEREAEQALREQQQADRKAGAQAVANAAEKAAEQRDVAQEINSVIDAREREKQELQSRERVADREQESRVNVKRDGDERQTQALERTAQTRQDPPRRHVDVLGQALSPSSTSVQAMFAKGRVSAPVDTVPPEIKMLMAATQELHRAAPSGVPDALVRMFAASPPLSKPDAPSNSPSLSTLLDPPQRRHSLSH